MNEAGAAAIVALTCMLCVVQIVVLWTYNQRLIRRRALLMQASQSRLILEMRQRLRSLLVVLSRDRRPRRMWKKPRSVDWWENYVMNPDRYPDCRWLEDFRMKRATFNYIVEQVRPILEPEPNQVVPNHAIPVEKCVAIAIYQLASCAEQRVVGNTFGVHKATVHNCVVAFCYAVKHLMMHEWISMPSNVEAEEISSAFEHITHIPQIIGAIDGSHIPITPPEDGKADYVNRTFYPSVVLQAVVDHKYRFRDISCRTPGSCHDATALRSSQLYQFQEHLMPKNTRDVNGVPIRPFILGDAAYPLLPWIITNYRYDAFITPEQDSFNAHMNSGRIVVENAFGRLKGRWRILQKRVGMSYTLVPLIVGTCCVLHNICETNRDAFMEEWLAAVAEAEIAFPQVNEELQGEYDDYNGNELRNLTKYLADNFPLRQSIRGGMAVLRQQAP